MIQRVLVILGAVLLLCGCARKQYLYLDDMVENVDYIATARQQARIQSDDRLRITVSCNKPALAVPFNVGTGVVSVDGDGNVTTSGTSGDANVYLVDALGDINFPVLGTLHLSGLTLMQAQDLIRDRIITDGHIKDPKVNIEFRNFHYTVLGAAGNNGTFTVDGDNITILEAIARAGDLTGNADIRNVAVIRETDGRRRVYNVDMTATDIFSSPVFYLAQNDIIYARPRKPKSQTTDRTFQILTVLLSIVSASCSVIWLTR